MRRVERIEPVGLRSCREHGRHAGIMAKNCIYHPVIMAKTAVRTICQPRSQTWIVSAGRTLRRPTANPRRRTAMKLLYFNDYRLGVLKGENVVDVMDVVRDIPAHRTAQPHQRADRALRRLPRRSSRRRPPRAKAFRCPACASARRCPKPHNIDCMAVNYMEDGTRAGARADQRLPQVAERDHRQRRHDGAAGRAGHDLRRRSGSGAGDRQARDERQGRRRDELHLRLHELHRRLGARAAARAATRSTR